MAITLEFLIILLLIVVNGVFAMSEIAVVSSRKSRLQRRADQGDRRARRALELANDPNRFLSTVQIGITAVGVFAGAFGGATLAQQLAGVLAGVPALARYAQAIGIGVVVVAITFATLVIGELVPKRIALTRPERIAARTAGLMHRLSRIATPLVKLLGWATEAVLRMLPDPAPDEPITTEEDIRVLLEQGTRAGVFLAAEQDIVENVFWLGDQRVDSVMTPRADIVWLDVDRPAADHARVMVEQPQARYVLCRGALDRVVGVVAMKDVWPATLVGQPLDVRARAITPLFVPSTTRALTLLEQFRKTRVHVALVVDDDERVEGLVTLTDILEGLVGELAELAEDEVVQREDGSWLISGTVRMEAIHDLLGLPAPSGEPDAGHRTVAELVTHHLGPAPAVAAYFVWEDHRVEVVDLDGDRIDKVLVAAVDPGGAGADARGPAR
ncbi:MAG TPA: hemolysin family protein [Longimicrobiales bacterium]|nr:hemolysin family protein [Longimicrobiales bacterium]